MGQSTPLPEPAKKELASLPVHSIDAFNKFFDGNKSLVYKLMMKMMVPAIDNNEPIVQFFRIGATPHVAALTRDRFESSLLQMVDWFTHTEEYELAGQAKNLLDKYKINKVIEDSKN